MAQEMGLSILIFDQFVTFARYLKLDHYFKSIFIFLDS